MGMEIRVNTELLKSLEGAGKMLAQGLKQVSVHCLMDLKGRAERCNQKTTLQPWINGPMVFSPEG